MIRHKIAILTEAQRTTAHYACRYMAEFSGMDGDITERDGRAARRVLPALAHGGLRIVQLDVVALTEVLAIAIANSCSCTNRRRRGHDAECHVTRHGKALDRVASLRDLLANATGGI